MILFQDFLLFKLLSMMGHNRLTKVTPVNPPPPQKKNALGQFAQQLYSLVFCDPL